MMLVDSHCHLNFPQFRDNLDAVVTRAKEAGVGVMQTICTDMAEFDDVLTIAERYDNIYCSVGVHPHESGKTDIVTPETLIAKAQHPKVIGIGETGLDYYYEYSDRESQRQSLLNHIEAARQTGLPLIVHTRDAEEDTIAILTTEYNKSPFTGVIHCFTASKQLAEAMLDIGFYISFSGIITFKNAQHLRDTAQFIPNDRILIETDSPFLAPMPHRGKTNEPSFIFNINGLIADIKQIDKLQSASITTENFYSLFSKAKRNALA